MTWPWLLTDSKNFWVPRSRHTLSSVTHGGNQEVTYDETLNPSQETRRKAGFQKIESCCGIAREYGLSYAWVDTCCIDKRSSAELSEAINSMYRWYSDAEVCFTYIVDVDSVPIGGATYSSAAQIQAFKKSRWFSRGWTLQELIAPRKRVFFPTAGR